MTNEVQLIKHIWKWKIIMSILNQLVGLKCNEFPLKNEWETIIQNEQFVNSAGNWYWNNGIWRNLLLTLENWIVLDFKSVGQNPC